MVNLYKSLPISLQISYQSANLVQVQFVCCTVQLNYGNMSWAYHEKSTISSHISLPEKGLQTTRPTLLCACRFMTYECLPPLLIFPSPFIESRKYYLLVKQSQLLRVHPCLRLMLFNQVIITFQSSYNMITNRKLRLK